MSLLAAEAGARLTAAASSVFPARRWSRSVDVAQLEDRVLLSASPLAFPSESVADVASVAAQPQASAPLRHELVFLNATVEHYQQLMDDLAGQDGMGRQMDFVVLDANRDGIAQVTEALAGRDRLDAVHFVTHGTDGAIQLGGTWLDGASVQTYASQIDGWSAALSADADLLFYGCDVAGSETGRALIDTLGALTGADVAATTDRTGHANLAGDWGLEYSAGSIETGVAFSQMVQQDWHGSLGILTVTTTADVLDGNTSSLANLIANPGADGAISLREAIIATNAATGADVIILPGGTYTLAIAGSDNAAAQGDLDVTGSLTISGAGATSTIIDANFLDRAFDIGSGTVTISDVTIQNGSQNNGGGIAVAGGSALTLTDVAVSNNSSNNGGGIHASGTLTLDRVTLSVNTSTGDGGAIYLNPGAIASLTNVTISGNSAASDGGAIYTLSTNVTLINSTIAQNTAAGVGGIHTQGSGGVTLKNTILSANANGNADAALMSLGYNIDSDGTAGLAGAGDQSGIDPLLGALQYNGGTLETHALLGGSPAIDAGMSAGAPIVDQRGNVRDASPDVGAFEFNGVANAPPVAVNDAYSVNEDGTLNVAAAGVLANDTDADGDPLTVTLFAGPSNGSVVLNANGSFSYTPAANFSGMDLLTYRASDGTANSIPAIVTITVNTVNDPPTASDGTFTAQSFSPNGTPVGIVSASDPDAGNVLAYSILSGNTGGAFALNPVTGHLTVANGTQLDPGVNPTFVLVVQADDGNGQTDTATITIDVVFPIAVVGASLVDSPLPELLAEAIGADLLVTQRSPSSTSPAPGSPPAAGQGSQSSQAAELPIAQRSQNAVAAVSLGAGGVIPSLATAAGSAAPPNGRTFDALPAPQRASVNDSRVAPSQPLPAEAIPASYAHSVTLLVQPGTLWHALDDLRQDMHELTQVHQVVAGAALTAAGGLTVGYVLWMVRGGLLLSSLVAQLPAWRLIDPLAVLDSVHDSEGEDDESLESIVERADAQTATENDR